MTAIAPVATPSSAIAEMRPMAEVRPIERGPGKPELGSAFGQILTEARTSEQHAADSAQKFANGDPSIGIHEVMIASEKAALNVRYATTLKNKLVEAYRELMNTQV